LISCGKVVKGVKESYDILKDFAPGLVVGFGSYYTLPVVIAAQMLGVPLILHEANSIPGRVTRYFSRFAAVTGVHFPMAEKFLKGSVVDVGMPLRMGYRRIVLSREESFQYFGIDPSIFTFLVFGGSQGALKLNTMFSSSVLDIMDVMDKFQVIHFTGSDAVAEETQHFYDSLGLRSYVRGFEKRMDLAWMCGDMVVSRAGALSIAEQLEFEVPGILVPYPYATDRHQEHNADFMVGVGGVKKILEGHYQHRGLGGVIAEILGKNKLEKMKNNMREYKRKAVRQDFCSLILERL
jgi:UDP-N-acetylglucosamine--N-acetylmuramyl-(pentapeptide) pyrophosphoryl-undecaprenol N-acetylglucosamine transferase